MLEMIDNYMIESSSIFELNLKKANVVIEAARRELAINKEEAELKVMTESGNDDDLNFYYHEAENGFVDTVIKAIKKIKEAIIRFFSEMKTKVLTLITKKENTEAIAKIEKKVKVFPLLGRKKILVEDYNAEAKCADAALAKFAGQKAKLKGKQEVTVEEIEETKKGFFEEHGTLIGVAAAITVTVSAALTAAKVMTAKANDRLTNLQKTSTSMCDDCAKIAETIDNPAAAQKLSDATASVAKTSQEDYVRCWKGMLTNISKAIKTFGKSKVDVDDAADSVKKESAFDFMEGSDNQDSLMSDKDMEKVANSIASTSNKDDMTEMGDDPANDIPGYGDDPEETSDIWDDVMGTAAGLDLDDDMDGYGEECESTFDKLFEKVSNCVGGCDGHSSSKPSNEKIIADLYNEISSNVKKDIDYSRQYATESAFDKLMSEIDDLF